MIASTPVHAAAQLKHNLTDMGRRASLAVKVLVRPSNAESDLSDYLSHHSRRKSAVTNASSLAEIPLPEEEEEDAEASEERSVGEVCVRVF